MEQTDYSRIVIRRIAESLSQQENSALLTQVQKLYLLLSRVHSSVEGEFPSALGTPAGRVGIWKRTATGEYTREQCSPLESRSWSDVTTIPLKSGKKRIVLVGESVARGYFYDPGYTPAKVLEQVVTPAFREGVEVIDLARSDLRPRALISLIGETSALAPDLLVVFAGNNWHFGDGFSLADFEQLIRGLDGGLQATRDYFVQRHLREVATVTMDRIAQFSAAYHIPAIVVVPEFNLLDWEAEPATDCPLLPKDRHAQWQALRLNAERAIRSKDWISAEKDARAMAALDEGLSPTTLRFLGRIEWHKGARKEARKYFEEARDAVCGLHISGSPRCPAVVQNVLRQRAAQHGFTLVDLPALFEEAASERIPGLNLFLDYCHLSSSGIALMAGATAETTCSLLGGNKDNLVEPPRPTASEEGIAHFLAALHNAQWGQPPETLDELCRRAMEWDRAIEQTACDYVDFRSRTTPDWASMRFSDCCANPRLKKYLFGVSNPNIKKVISRDLIGAIYKSAHPKSQERIFRVLHRHQGQWTTLDLLKTALKSRTSRAEIEIMPVFFVAKEQVSRFTFFRTELTRLELFITYRVAPTAQSHAVLLFNENAVGNLHPVAQWHSLRFVLEDHFQNGMNQLEISWPAPHSSLEQSRRTIEDELERCSIPDVFPTYGELSQLKIAAPEAPRRDLTLEPNANSGDLAICI